MPSRALIAFLPLLLQAVRSQDEYHVLLQGAGCLEGTRIEDVDECQDAGKKLNLELRNGFTPVSGQWDHVQCGCSVAGADVHYDTDFGPGCNHEGRFSPICKGPLPAASEYHFQPFGASGICKNGPVETVDECRTAVLALGGELRNNAVVTGAWYWVPGGCSIQIESGDAHFNTDATNRSQDGHYAPVCKGPSSPDYYVQSESAPPCEFGNKIMSERICRDAALGFGGNLRDTANAVVGAWDHVPCGCSIQRSTGDIHYNTAAEGICNKGQLGFTSVCQESFLGGLKFHVEYTMADIEFVDVEFEEESFSVTGTGDLSNCAQGATVTRELNIVQEVQDVQSMTVSKSFTSSSTQSITVGASVTISASADFIFGSATAEATASFGYENEWSSSNTEEESQTLETVETVTLSWSTTIELEPETCVRYSMSYSTSTEPVDVPYQANVHMTLFYATNNGAKDAQVEDGEVLQQVVDLMEGYGASVQGNVIVYPVEGIYKGSYISEDTVSSTSCECPTTDDGDDEDSGVDGDDGFLSSIVSMVTACLCF